jgi:hypothetical protein
LEVLQESSSGRIKYYTNCGTADCRKMTSNLRGPVSFNKDWYSSYSQM